MCRIEWWGDRAFRSPDAAHCSGRIDSTVVGALGRFTNKAAYLDDDDPRVFVGVWPAVDATAVTVQGQVRRRAVEGLPTQPDPRHLQRAENEVQCLVSTGAKQSVFKSEVAESLRLNPNRILPDKVQLVPVPTSDNQAAPCLCAEVELWLDLLPGVAFQLVYVPVFFPVERVQDRSTGLPKYRWKTDLPWENILGVRELLNQVMLCFTPQVLYVFPRKR